MIPAYECTSSSSCDDIVKFVDQILPPLSEWDEVKLCVSLPLLAAVIRSSQAWRTLDSAILDTLRSMITYLAQFSIASADHDPHARSAAASCLFSILFHGNVEDDSDGGIDIIQKLLAEVVSPALEDALTCLNNELSDSLTPRVSGSVTDDPEDALLFMFSRVEDTLDLLSVLVSHI